MQVHQANVRQMFEVSHISAFVAFAKSTIQDPASLSPQSDVFHTILTTCKASLL
jgi:hypothetical protein